MQTKATVPLKESLLKHDDNVHKLSQTFFPPISNPPQVVRVTYNFGENIDESEVWFWTSDSYYLFIPIEMFQYMSLFFSRPAYFFTKQIWMKNA